MQDNDELQTIVGQLDIFDGLDGQKLTVTTAEGDEYLIASKKWFKKLSKYADENITITFEGTLDYDPEEGMDVLSIKSYKPSEEVEDDLPTLLSLNEDIKMKKDKNGKTPLIPDDELPEDDENGLPWDDINEEDEDAEPNPEELDDEDIPDDINLDDLEDETPEKDKK